MKPISIFVLKPGSCFLGDHMDSENLVLLSKKYKGNIPCLFPNRVFKTGLLIFNKISFFFPCFKLSSLNIYGFVQRADNYNFWLFFSLGFFVYGNRYIKAYSLKRIIIIIILIINKDLVIILQPNWNEYCNSKPTLTLSTLW